jgi:hypothetical protein
MEKFVVINDSIRANYDEIAIVEGQFLIYQQNPKPVYA